MASCTLRSSLKGMLRIQRDAQTPTLHIHVMGDRHQGASHLPVALQVMCKGIAENTQAQYFLGYSIHQGQGELRVYGNVPKAGQVRIYQENVELEYIPHTVGRHVLQLQYSCYAPCLQQEGDSIPKGPTQQVQTQVCIDVRPLQLEAGLTLLKEDLNTTKPNCTLQLSLTAATPALASTLGVDLGALSYSLCAQEIGSSLSGYLVDMSGQHMGPGSALVYGKNLFKLHIEDLRPGRDYTLAIEVASPCKTSGVAQARLDLGHVCHRAVQALVADTKKSIQQLASPLHGIPLGSISPEKVLDIESAIAHGQDALECLVRLQEVAEQRGDTISRADVLVVSRLRQDIAFAQKRVQVAKMTPGQLNGVQQGKTPMMQALYDGDAEQLMCLAAHPQTNINATDDKGNTILHYALQCKDVDPALLQVVLMQPDIDIHAQNNHGDTPLHILCQQGCKGPIATYIDLFEKSGSVANLEGDLPMHIAVRNGRMDCVQPLLGLAGCSLDTPNHAGDLPIHTAIYSKQASIARMLAESPLQSVRCENANQERICTVLHRLIQQGDTSYTAQEWDCLRDMGAVRHTSSGSGCMVQ